MSRQNAPKTLAGGSLPELISPYMRNLISTTGGEDGPIGRQFLWREDDRNKPSEHTDPQMEAEHEVAPGVIYKYRGELRDDGSVRFHGRILWTISRYCATYCRFCFRGRMVGLPAHAPATTRETLAQKPFLTTEDMEKVMNFLDEHHEINEVILSGGDPLVVPEQYLSGIMARLNKRQEKGLLDILRIHTRAPVTNPAHLRDWHYRTLASIRRPHIVLHINHPAELTPEVRAVVQRLQDETGAFLFSQSVLLAGVNDAVETLYDLFTTLTKYGIRPYYLHQNDPVYWARSFTVPLHKAIPLWQELRRRLSGMASTAKFVIDTPYGNGKVPVPEGEWSADATEFVDFKGKRHRADPLL